jgi:hypothetical protein
MRENEGEEAIEEKGGNWEVRYKEEGAYESRVDETR